MYNNSTSMSFIILPHKYIVCILNIIDCIYFVVFVVDISKGDFKRNMYIQHEGTSQKHVGTQT